MKHDVLAIVHAAGGLVVCDKPAGPPSTGATPETPGSIEFMLARQLGRRVWAVHQLDRQTSGCNLFVLKKSLVQSIGAALAAGQKTYVAVVHGAIDKVCDINLAIGTRRDAASGKTFPTIGGETPRDAHTHVVPLRTSSNGDFTLVAALPATGRTHQIRLHLAAFGHPLVGEKLHRDPPCDLGERHFLHAFRIVLAATATSPHITVTAPLPADMAAFVIDHFAVEYPADIADMLASLPQPPTPRHGA